MIVILSILLALALLLVAGLLLVTYRFYRKAVIYDEIFQYLYDDIETNIFQFAKMARMNVMMADSEVQLAHRNMMTMGKRLEEILHRMEEATGLRLRPPPPKPRPKVV